MPITRKDAAEIARQNLDDIAAEINAYGSALPGHADRTPTEVVVTIEKETDDGWIFAYNSRAYVDGGNPSAMLAGNYPIFVARSDGSVHSTADLEYRHYLDHLTK
jgi:hypothetical protein